MKIIKLIHLNIEVIILPECESKVQPINMQKFLCTGKKTTPLFMENNYPTFSYEYTL